MPGTVRETELLGETVEEKVGGGEDVSGEVWKGEEGTVEQGDGEVGREEVLGEVERGGGTCGGGERRRESKCQRLWLRSKLYGMQTSVP